MANNNLDELKKLLQQNQSNPEENAQSGGTASESDKSARNELLNKYQNAPSSLSNTASKQTAQAAGSNTGYQYNAYQESDAVKQAYNMLQNQLANKPGEYTSAWQTQLNDTLNKILNREKFSYDMNADALYQQYKDQYMLGGKMAMMDTIGQTTALTGGYGNSYAQSAGQQAYHGYLQQLNNKLPELYQLALNKYQMDGDDLSNQAALIAQMEGQDYGRYRDTVSDYYSDLDRLQNQYYTERDYDYGKWADDRDFGYGVYADDRNFQYQQDRDKIEDERWQKEFDEAVRQWNHANGISGSKSSSSKKSSGSGSGGGSGYDPAIAREQEELNAKGANLVVDGIDGPKTQEAREKYGNGGGSVLSEAGKKFMNSVPYAHAGSDIGVWKNVVDERLENAYTSGQLSEDDVVIIAKQLGLS